MKRTLGGAFNESVITLMRPRAFTGDVESGEVRAHEFRPQKPGQVAFLRKPANKDVPRVCQSGYTLFELAAQRERTLGPCYPVEQSAGGSRGERSGQHSIWINARWRIRFRWVDVSANLALALEDIGCGTVEHWM